MRNVVRTSELNRYRNIDTVTTSISVGDGLTYVGGNLTVAPSGIVAGDYENGVFNISSTGQITSVDSGLLCVTASITTGAYGIGRIQFGSITYNGPNPGYIVDSVETGPYTAFTCVPGLYLISFAYESANAVTDLLTVEKDGVAVYQGGKAGGQTAYNEGMCVVESSSVVVITASMPAAVTVDAAKTALLYPIFQIIKIV